jgi:hypothetical protein
VIRAASNVVAVGALASPGWLPTLVQISDIAGQLLPILGALWLFVQIVHFIWIKFKK